MRTPAVKSVNQEAITMLHCDGMTISEIAEQLHMEREIVLRAVCWYMHYGTKVDE